MRTLLLILFIPAIVWGQENSRDQSQKTLEYYVGSFSQVYGSNGSSTEISTFVKNLERKQLKKNSQEFVRHIFLKTRHEFLRHYAEYASFTETLAKGKFNCLTGTALYALLLNHFDIEYKVIETNYHIFLLVSTDKGPILLEATDPLNGFVDKPKDIQDRIGQYKQNRISETAADKKYYRYNFELYNEVTLDQIKGLFHYNLSIVAYNKQDLSGAIHHLSNALELYNSPRITEFSTILLLSVLESTLDDQSKENCLKSIQAIRRKQLPVMASRNSTN